MAKILQKYCYTFNTGHYFYKENIELSIFLYLCVVYNYFIKRIGEFASDRFGWKDRRHL